MINSDCHCHSTFSEDGIGTMEEMVKGALDKKLKGITFTEHCDFYFPKKEGERPLFEVDTKAYKAKLDKMREIYGNEIRIGYGIELGLQTKAAGNNSIYISENDFDFVIGSVHVLQGQDPYEPDIFERIGEESTYRLYFETIVENIKAFEDFDVLGHMDYIVRYGPNMDKYYSYEVYKDIIDEALKLLIQKGKGIEINTAGLRKGVRDVHPTMKILEKYRELGGETVTIGSDAHRPEDLAGDFERAEKALREAGFKYYAVFENRKPVFCKI